MKDYLKINELENILYIIIIFYLKNYFLFLIHFFTIISYVINSAFLFIPLPSMSLCSI